MSRRPVVVDGSNLATEGRSMPSLAQLDEAVRAWLAENPDDEVIVVVDASFSYRIDESERKTFEEAEEAGEVVSPPAGAVGRGDGFLLRIADRVDGAVLSNDSFQEFHGEYKWLFDSGRLLGGKPVPGVGWIFTPRTPVRGPKSRMAVRDAQRATKSPRSAPVVKAIAQATAEAIEAPEASGARRNRRRGGRGAESAPVTTHEAINEPLPFVTFIAEHPLGTEVEGTVASFTSHGAFVDADGARCYVPVVGLGDPPPRTAKAVLRSGEVRTFVVQALDPPRRGIELALPEVARVAGAPTEETVEAEIDAGGARRAAPQRSAAGIPPPPRGPRTPASTPTAARSPSGLPSGGRARTSPPDDDAVTSGLSGPLSGMADPAVEPVSEPAVRGPRRSPRRAASGRTVEEASVQSPTPATTPEPAPARRSRRVGAPEPVTPDPGAGEGTPKRRRRKAAAAAAEPGAAVADAPRARRSAKKAAAAPAPAATADEAATSASPARSRRAAKKAAPVTETPLTPIDTRELLDETVAKKASRPARAGKRPAEPSEPAKSQDPAPAPVAPPRKGRTPKPVPASKAAAEPPAGETTPARRATKSAAKKAPAKKAPAKKAPAKKAPAKKAAKKVAAEAPADEPSPPAKRARRRPS